MIFADFIPPMSAIAQEAGGLLLAYFHRRVKVEYKGEADLVTEADRASEALIIARIHALWPDHDIIGEEGTRTDSGSDWRWYVDPLDGTTNFAHGFPVFCISMALEHRGERVAGVIYDPTRNELFSASKGGGACLNGEVIQVSATPTIRESLLATGFPSRKRHQNPNIHFYHQLTLRSHGVRRPGSAALDLAYVACGRLDAFWEFNLNPWDTAAGVLMVEEAGGRVGDFKGCPFHISSREVMATNKRVHEELIKIFGDIFTGRELEEPASPVTYINTSK